MEKMKPHMWISSRLLMWILLVMVLGGGMFRPECVTAASFTRFYPHWDPADHPKALLIERFLQRNRHQRPVCVFDFDGTLINEKVVGPDGVVMAPQPVWHVWGAYQLQEMPFLFPRFRSSGDIGQWRKDLLAFNRVLEAGTNVKPDSWMKFYAISTFEAGMTPAEMEQGLERFMDQYRPRDLFFLPMLDVLQRAIDLRFRVYILSGSNPYLINAFLRRITEEMEYQPGRRYDFAGLVKASYSPVSPDNPAGSRILGNMARLTDTGTFSQVYDDRFCFDPQGRMYVIEGEGKRVALENYIEPLEKAPAVFFAGNSDNDYVVTKTILDRRPGNLGVMVNPRGREYPTLAGKGTVVLHFPEE